MRETKVIAWVAKWGIQGFMVLFCLAFKRWYQSVFPILYFKDRNLNKLARLLRKYSPAIYSPKKMIPIDYGEFPDLSPDPSGDTYNDIESPQLMFGFHGNKQHKVMAHRGWILMFWMFPFPTVPLSLSLTLCKWTNSQNTTLCYQNALRSCLHRQYTGSLATANPLDICHIIFLVENVKWTTYNQVHINPLRQTNHISIWSYINFIIIIYNTIKWL